MSPAVFDVALGFIAQRVAEFQVLNRTTFISNACRKGQHYLMQDQWKKYQRIFIPVQRQDLGWYTPVNSSAAHKYLGASGYARKMKKAGSAYSTVIMTTERS